MIRKLSPLLLLIGLFSCQSDPYQVDVDNVKLSVQYNNLDSAFRYAHDNQRLRQIKALLQTDFDLSQFSFPYALQVSTQTDTAFLNGLKRLYAHPFNIQVSQALDKQEKWRLQTFREIEAGLKRLHFLAPKATKSQTYLLQLHAICSQCIRLSKRHRSRTRALFGRHTSCDQCAPATTIL